MLLHNRWNACQTTKVNVQDWILSSLGSLIEPSSLVHLYFITCFPTIGPPRTLMAKEFGHKPNKNVQEHFNNLLVGLRVHIELN
jgi:hypothetical protein